MDVLDCAGESLPCRAAAKSGKRSFELILCKGVLSVCLLFLCSTSPKSFQWEERYVKELASLGEDLWVFSCFGLTRLFPPAALIVWLGPKPGPDGLTQ